MQLGASGAYSEFSGAREGVTMQCPLCQADLAEFPVGRVTLDRCAKCAALWFDRTELSAVLQQTVTRHPILSGVPTSRPPSPASPPCPRHPQHRMHGLQWRTISYWGCAVCHGLLLKGTDWDALLCISEERQSRKGGGAVESVLEVFSAMLEGIAHVLS